MLLFHMNLNKPLSVVIPQVRVQKFFFFFKIYDGSSARLAPMWQQSGTLLFCSCHGIAGFLVDELQI